MTPTGISVTHFRRRCAAFVAIAATALFHLGCGDGVGLPDEGVPTEIKAFSGDDQTGSAGTTLGKPVVVQVTDRSGRPVANQSVAFAPASGSGSVTPASVKTDNQGKASTAWTLGGSAGPQSLTATAEGGNAPEGLDVGLTAHAVSGAATRIEIASGKDQTGPVSSALADSLVVRVVDVGGNPVAGVEVHWSVIVGGGTVLPEVVVTGNDGLAAAERVLGESAGPQSAQADAFGLDGSPLTFNHTAVPATPTRLIKVSGDGQSAPAGFPLADSLVVKLVDQNGNGVGGRPVTWVVGGGEGSVDPVNSTTTPQGLAVTRWTMPAATGVYSIDAVFSGVDPVGFTGTATSDVPTTIELVSGDHQSASVGGQLPAPLKVKVTDGNGNPVENVAVTWTANGGGSVGATSTGTDAQGIAEVTRTLGVTPGTYTTTAEVAGLSGSPITFTSTATVGPAAKLTIVTQPSSTAQSGVPLETQPVIQLQDAAGNDVALAGRAITAGVIGGSVTGATASTDASGKATFTSLAIVGSAGQSFQITFTSGVLLPATSDLVTLSPGNVGKIAFTATPPTTVSAGVVWVQHPVVQLQDAAGNALAIPDVNIVANIQTGGGTLNGTKTVATDDNGQAEFTDLSISGKAGARTVRFRNPALPVSAAITATVNVVAGPASKISAASDVSQNGTPGTAVAEPPAVLVADAFDNPVAGIAVTFAVTAGGGTIAPTTPVTTGADGIAALTSWTLGPSQGANTVTASATGLTGSPVTFNASVAAINTSTQISGAPSSSVVGEPVDVTVTVTSGSGTPTGSVSLTVDNVDQGSKTLSGGQAVFPVTFTTADGHHKLAAAYTGEGAFGGSNDNLDYAVNEAETSVSVVSDHAGQTPPQGESIQFTATLSVTAPGAGTPTGSVQFKDNGSNLGAPVALTGGTAVLPTTELLEGSHSITAEYLGDANFAGSTSDAISQDVGPPPDTGPIGMGETYNTDEDTPLQPDPGGGVLANDSDPDGDPITAVLVSPPQHSSTFSLNSDGSFNYQPAANYNGPDSFTYRASANGLATGVLTASLNVAPVNDAPVAADDDAGTSPVDVTVSQPAPGVLGNDSDLDGDGLTAVLDQNVTHGTLALNADGSFSYTPEAGYTGLDAFQYHAFDGTAASNTVTVTFLVTP